MRAAGFLAFLIERRRQARGRVRCRRQGQRAAELLRRGCRDDRIRGGRNPASKASCCGLLHPGAQAKAVIEQRPDYLLILLEHQGRSHDADGRHSARGHYFASGDSPKPWSCVMYAYFRPYRRRLAGRSRPADTRGFFTAMCREPAAAHGIDARFIPARACRASLRAGIVRGMHFQRGAPGRNSSCA